MTRYQSKLLEISNARNSKKTASKVRGVKWNSSQLSNIQKIASQELMPSKIDIITLYPKMSDYKINIMLSKYLIYKACYYTGFIIIYPIY